MRYEIGYELLEMIKVDPIFKGNAKLTPMIASIPSETRFGMASLLPNREINYKDKTLYVNNMSSVGTENRDKILKTKNSSFAAIQFETIDVMNRNELRQYMQDKSLVYIYHNVIDNAGENSENKVFDVVNEALNEILKLVKNLYNTLQIANYYITADLAISEKETADYSVFIVAGVDENKLIHIKNVVRERLDGREIVDTLISLQRIYEPELVGIEEMQVSKAIGPFLREEMIRTGVYLNLNPMKHNGKDKIARAKSIQARVRAHAVKLDKAADWYPAFEDELTKFPRGTKDDQVDAFAYLGLMLDSLIEAPTKAEQEDEEYYDELNRAHLGNDGRSTSTGY
jgi:predicted phage terminase large subunit-like protein